MTKYSTKLKNYLMAETNEKDNSRKEVTAPARKPAQGGYRKPAQKRTNGESP